MLGCNSSSVLMSLAKDLGFISMNLWKVMIVFVGLGCGTSIFHVIVFVV